MHNPAPPGDADYVSAKVQFGAGVSRIVECPKGMVGRVIGKGGETIKALQRTYQVGNCALHVPALLLAASVANLLVWRLVPVSARCSLNPLVVKVLHQCDSEACFV